MNDAQGDSQHRAAGPSFDPEPDECQSDGAQPAWLSEAYLQSAFHLNYQVTRVLGCGTFGRAYEVRARDDQDETYVAKVCDLRVHAEDDVREEYKMLTLAPAHQNCVQVIEAYFEDPYSYIIVEKCSESLTSAIMARDVVSEETLVFYFRQAFQALEAIHAARIVHHDVKLDNLMAQGDIVKLIDFGQAAKEPENGQLLRGTPGTPPFMSPEMVRGDGHTVGTDVWSLGVCMYVCMLGHFPYSGLARTSTVMKAAIRLGVPRPAFCLTGQMAALQGPSATISAHAEGLLRAVLQRRPERRLAAAEALRHAWLGTGADLSSPSADERACGVDFKVSMEAAGKAGAFSMASPTVLQQMDQDLIDLQEHANDFISYCSTRDNADVD